MEKEKEMYDKFFLIILLFLSVISCNKNNKTMEREKFDYAVTVAAPTEYPVEVHIGYLLDKNRDYICGVPRVGMEQAGWQWDGSEGGMGGSVMPQYLSLIYIAYAEKKFYQVEGELPIDKILKAFRKGYDKIDRLGKIIHETYDRLTIGTAPGGVIVVWLSGSNNRIEICRLQAKETIVDPNEFARRENLYATSNDLFNAKFNVISDSIKQEIKQNGIPYGLWDKYRDKYKYRFVFRPYDERDKFTHNYYLYYNGEADEVLQEELDKKEYIEKGIPYTCNFIFTSYSTEIIFNDREMLEIFKNFKNKYPNSPIDIIITPTFMYNDMKISVKCEKEEIPLKKHKVVGVWGGE